MIYLEKPENFVVQFEAVGCFVESKGQFLQLLRGNRKIEPYKWGSPAGGVEKGESAEIAVARELREETGLVMLPEQFRRIVTFFVKYPVCNFTYTLFWINYKYRPEIRLSDEHVAYTWIPPHLAKTLDLMQDEWECIKVIYVL